MTDHDSPEGLDPDEPSTPLWFTLLGGALFVVAAVFYLVSGDEADPTEAADSDVAAESADAAE